jgi:hypothetical protein
MSPPAKRVPGSTEITGHRVPVGGGADGPVRAPRVAWARRALARLIAGTGLESAGSG